MSLSVKVARSRSVGRGPGVGDPGLFGSIGSLIGKVAGVAKSLPGPIGWAGSAVSRIQQAFQPGQTYVPPVVATRPARQVSAMQRAAAQMRPAAQPAFFPMEDFGTQVQKPGVLPAIQRLLPGGETGMMPAVNGKIGAPSGYHVNKSDYFLKDGTFVPAGSRWVKNRHRNPLNPRAASKAIGRIESLKRATARFSNITIRKKCKK